MCVSRLALQVSHLYYGFEMQCLREVLMKPRLLFPSLTLGSHSIMLTRECVCVCVATGCCEWNQTHHFFLPTDPRNIKERWALLDGMYYSCKW